MGRIMLLRVAARLHGLAGHILSGLRGWMQTKRIRPAPEVHFGFAAINAPFGTFFCILCLTPAGRWGMFCALDAQNAPSARWTALV